MDPRDESLCETITRAGMTAKEIKGFMNDLTEIRSLPEEKVPERGYEASEGDLEDFLGGDR